jgi:bifunctional non-homologous end joining protein LigD
MPSRFVIHEHHASHLHFDFRLESEGVLRSWVLPKGPSMNPSDKRLALEVEDHALEYIDFEGIIPQGQYGAGTVVIWDRGTYDPIEIGKGKISFTLDGGRLKGAFTLTYLKGRGKGNEWLLIKRKDQYAQPSWRLETSLTPEKQAELQEQIPPCETA